MLTIFMKQLVFIKEIWKIIRLLNDKIVSFAINGFYLEFILLNF